MTLELINQTFQSYGFTLRKTKAGRAATREEYLKHLSYISHGSQFCVWSDVVFEETSGLHCHGIVKINKSTNLIRFRFRGWNMKLEELYDPNQWLLYLNKDQPNLPIDMIDPQDPSDFIMPKYKMFPKLKEDEKSEE